jgi:hypothetical protein
MLKRRSSRSLRLSSMRRPRHKVHMDSHTAHNNRHHSSFLRVIYRMLRRRQVEPEHLEPVRRTDLHLPFNRARLLSRCSNNNESL